MKTPLPVIQYPTYHFTVPSTGKQIKFRTFNVREEKNLLTAVEGKDFPEMILAIKQLIANCTFGEVDVEAMTTFDIELLFLQMRSKSVSDEITINLYKNSCKKKTDGTRCDEPTELTIDIKDVGVMVKSESGEFEAFNKETHKSETVVRIGENVAITLRYPGFSEYQIIKTLNKDKIGVRDIELELIARCLVYITEGENMIKAESYTVEERVEFLNNLDKNSLMAIEKFFEKVPRIRYACEYKCAHCDHKEPYVLEDVQNFLNAR